MALALRNSSEPAPMLAPLAGLVVTQETNPAVLALIQDRPVEAIAARFADGHRAYVAWLDNVPAAFGWIATRSASIGEFGMRFTLPQGERYLWNFVTLPSHRGLGIYPRLLDAIVQREAVGIERFWVAYAPENHASGSGIRNAGFRLVAEFSIDASGEVAVRDRVVGGGAAAAALLGVKEATDPLAPCWHCGRALKLMGSCNNAAGCSCDYQRPERPCHGAAAV